MGTHRSGTSSRGVSRGPVIAAVALVLVAAAVFAWFRFQDRSSERDNAAAGRCVEGESTLAVTVDPDIEAPVRAIAAKYNASEPVVRDHCAQVRITTKPSAVVGPALTGDSWDEAALGPRPGLWIADSSRTIETARVPGLIEGDPTPIASSPIVLGVAEPLRQALEQAQIAWSQLPGLQQGSLGEVGLSGWGGLRMAMPAEDSTHAAALAVGATLSGTDPLTLEAASSGQVLSAVSGLAAAAPEATTTGAALDVIATALTPEDADIHAVAATEQQVAAHMGVVAYRPPGATVIADHPAALISGPWVDQTQNLIATVFTAYLRAPAQASLLTDAGFTAPPPTPVPGADRETLAKIATAFTAPVLGVRATVLLDVSSSMTGAEGSGTRLSNSVGALRSTLNVMPPEFGLGVWTFGKNLDGSSPYRVIAQTAGLTTAQRGDVDEALGAVRASSTSSDQAYPALLAAYRAAVADHADGLTNSVLLITDGPDDDSSLTGAQLLADIAAAGESDHPVRVDVVVIGGEGTQTMQDLAARTGGTYTRVESSSSLPFAQAVVKALTIP